MSESRGRGTEKSQKNSSRATREQGFEILARESSNNIVYMFVTYIYKYICRGGCNLTTLVVGIKALHHPKWASREENLQKIGVSSDSLIA